MWHFHCDPPSQWNFRSPISKERGCPLPIQCECSKNLSSLCPWAPPSVTIGAATFPCSSYTTAVSPSTWISPSHSPVEEARGCLVRRPSKKTESDSTQICKLTNTQKIQIPPKITQSVRHCMSINCKKWNSEHHCQYNCSWNTWSYSEFYLHRSQNQGALKMDVFLVWNQNQNMEKFSQIQWRIAADWGTLLFASCQIPTRKYTHRRSLVYGPVEFLFG